MCFNIASWTTETGELLGSSLNLWSGTTPVTPGFPGRAGWNLSGFAHPIVPIADWQTLQAAAPEAPSCQWGLIPHWVTDRTRATELRNMTLNARSETVWEKPSFRDAIATGRCLIPVLGFYEPHHHAGSSYPFYIHRRDEQPFWLAGICAEPSHRLYEDATSNELQPAEPVSNDARPRKTFAIITVAAQGLLRSIHNAKLRMPLIFPQSDSRTGAAERWLHPSLTRREVDKLFAPRPPLELTAHAVSRALFYSRDRTTANSPATIRPHRYGIPAVDQLVPAGK